VWLKTSRLYQELYERLTGQTFVPASFPAQARVLKALDAVKGGEVGA
jgi:hypothetical protein